MLSGKTKSVGCSQINDGTKIQHSIVKIEFEMCPGIWNKNNFFIILDNSGGKNYVINLSNVTIFETVRRIWKYLKNF